MFLQYIMMRASSFLHPFRKYFIDLPLKKIMNIIYKIASSESAVIKNGNCIAERTLN